MSATGEEMTLPAEPSVGAPAVVGTARGFGARGNASPGLVLTIVSVGMCLANLDLFIVNVALPSIAKDFDNAPLGSMSWILNGYAIAYAALLVLFGRLAERHRRDASFLAGVALFTLASAACAAATSVETLTAFRVVQAAGAALMTPTSLGLLLAVYPPDQRAGAVRTWTAIGGLAAALGPVAGGVLVTASWRWIFLVNVPAGLLAMLVGWWKLPEISGHEAARPNPFDAAFVTAGIGALVFAIVNGNEWGWASPAIVGILALSAALLAAFVVRCLIAKAPFVDPKMFRIRAFSGAALVMAPYAAAFGAMLLSAALWAQSAWGWSALETGLAIAPGPLMVPLTSLVFSKRLIARFGAPTVIAAGIASFAAGLAWWSTMIGLEPSVASVVIGMIPIGVGVGLTFPTLMGVGIAGLPTSSFATGSGVINMIRQAMLAVGVAVFVAIVGQPASAAERLAHFQRGWWTMIAVIALGLAPTFLLLRARRDR